MKKNQLFNQQQISKDHSNEYFFDWSIDKKEIDSCLFSTEIIINKLKQHHDKASILLKIDSTLWNDAFFIDILDNIEFEFLKFIPQDEIEKRLFNVILFQFTDCFLYLWDNYYFQKYKDNVEYQIHVHGICANIEVSNKLVKIDFSFYNILPLQMRANKNLFEQAFQNYRHYFSNRNREDYFIKNISLASYPPEIFEDLKCLKKIIEFYFLKMPHRLTHYPFIFQSWQNDSEKIKNLFQYLHDNRANNSIFEDLFQTIDANLKNNEQLAFELLNIYPEIFYHLPYDLQNNHQIIHEVIDKLDFLKPILANFIIQSKNKKLVKRALIDQPCIFKKLPKDFQNDEEILLHFIEHQSIELKKNKQLLQILKNKFKDESFVDQSIAVNPFIYENLPHKYKNKQRTLLYLKYVFKNRNINYEIKGQFGNIIPQELYNDYDFCMNTVDINQAFIFYIPEHVWKDTRFALYICQKLDDREMSHKSLDFFPSYVREFFQKYQVTNNYSNFLKKAVLNFQLKKRCVILEVESKNKKI